MKSLPWCGVCGKVKDLFVHDIDFKNAPNYDYHEFDPCVTLKEYEEKTEKQSVCIDGLKQGLLIEIKTRQEFEQKLFNLKKRDERLAKELRKVVLDVEILDLDEVIPVIEKVVGELKKKGGLK